MLELVRAARMVWTGLIEQSASEIDALWNEAGAYAATLSDKQGLRVHLTQHKG
jgi:hypothetical protein